MNYASAFASVSHKPELGRPSLGLNAFRLLRKGAAFGRILHASGLLTGSRAGT